MSTRSTERTGLAATGKLRAGISVLAMAAVLSLLPAAVALAQDTTGTPAIPTVLDRMQAADAEGTGDAASDYVTSDQAVPLATTAADTGLDDQRPLTTGSTQTEPMRGTRLLPEAEADYKAAESAKPYPPVQAGPGGTRDEDPYAPLGIDLGSFILRPFVELGVTYQHEVTGSETGDDTTTNSVLGDSTLRLQMESDWARHAASIDAYGSLERPFKGDGDLEPEAGIDAELRLDITKRTTLTANFGYAYALDDPQSAAFEAATDAALTPAVTGTNDPATQVFDGGLTLRHETNSLFGEAEIAAERTTYGDAELSDGTTLSQGDLNNTVYDGRLRLGFAASPALSPFVEASYGIRRMDEAVDSGGARRDATRYGLRAGTEFDFGEKLNGEVALGYIAEDIEDDALEDLAGIAADASVTWSPQRGTDVTLNMSTTTDIGTSNGSSGSVLYAAGLGITHELRSNITAEASFGTEFRDASGAANETAVSGEAGLTYWFNRFAGLTTRLRHERTLSSDPSKEDQTSSAFVGLKLQR